MALFGWRARIGFISPRRGKIHTSAIEMQMLAPDGVLVHTADLEGPRSLGREDCLAMLDEIPDAAKLLSHGDAAADVIVMGAAPICLNVGPDTVVETIEKAAGLPATTVMHGLVNGLRHVDAKRVVVVTPYYPDELVELLRRYVEQQGFEIAALVTGGGEVFGRHKSVPQEHHYRFAKDAFLSAGGADALLMVGGGAPTNEIIDVLETDIGKPVVASNFASMWNALRMVHVRQSIPGYGQLLRDLDRS